MRTGITSKLFSKTGILTSVTSLAAALAFVGADAFAYGKNRQCVTITDSIVCQFKSPTGLTEAQWSIEKGVKSAECTGAGPVNESNLVVRSGNTRFHLQAPQHIPAYRTDFDGFLRDGFLLSRMYLTGNPDFGSDEIFELQLRKDGERIVGTAALRFNLNADTKKSDIFNQIRSIDEAAEKSVAITGNVDCVKLFNH